MNSEINRTAAASAGPPYPASPQRPYRTWIGLALTVVLTGVVFYDAIAFLIAEWMSKDEYSHGFMIPLLSAYFIWRHWGALASVSSKGTLWGIALLIFGILAFFIGELATLYTVEQYALLLVIAGLVMAWKGYAGISALWPAVVFLFFMIPLPDFLYNQVSAFLQLISSEIGAAVIRGFGIAVLLKGNVIDLGAYKLQVAEACNGLRYLFPLLSFGFICAYVYRASLWERVVVFISTIPITVLMNSFRIGVIGVLVENWGPEQAEGFLHSFEGWIIFVACLVLLFGEMWLLNRLLRPNVSFWDVMDFSLVAPSIEPSAPATRSVSGAFPVAIAALVVTIVGTSLLQVRDEVIPSRSTFATFPAQIADWKGQRSPLEDIYIRALKFTDYLFANYWDGAEQPVNLYVAYYESQSKGRAVHSPRSCIPGGGWEISALDQISIDDRPDAGALRVNRVQIQLGSQRQLVYYWFHQRGRIVTNEYAVKWYLLWDAITQRRTDGALVRVMTSVEENETWENADARLTRFLRSLNDELTDYLPS